MQILLLGGTGFLGRELARAALDGSHTVTCLARGSAPAASGANFVRADRDDPDALAPVVTQAWDAVVDLTSHPAHAHDAVHQLTARHRLLVSTTSVYAAFDTPNQSENAPLAPPAGIDRMTEMNQYPGAKRRCEDIYRGADGQVTVIRPGLIGGAGDDTGRSGYYPWRFAHPTGPDVLVPDATFPVSVIDVADLAAWILHCIEHTVTGTFNAAGQTHTLADLYRASIEVTGSAAQPHVIPDDVLLSQGVAPWAGPNSLPLWIPLPGFRHVGSVDSSAALAHGLVRRPLGETLAAALATEEARTTERPVGLTDQEETALRAALSPTGG
ncbi:nucleoside-diphosphate-sugar epimerase [Micrococcus sp. 140720015-1]|uniref:NAD-dependent epimerase/dehydratase family protein n=1 Tax=Micrococcus luteus TaxID=1270 RepID=UPI00162AAA62|nr:NAD-dependent epimerase/dehydratase family protein [Micrococcus luteus]MCV7593693.1 NAD(P)H-binding protein [Micrococcus luteus]